MKTIVRAMLGWALLASLCAGLHSAENADQSLGREALVALERAVEFFRTKVAVEGTYVWQYSEDLALREGEGKASATTGWVQPPGTPAVGLAFLAAHDATGQRSFLDAATETAKGLRRGQLHSGGWTYQIGFSDEERRRFAYRDKTKVEGRNVTTFDDDTTQAALRFLVRLDGALGFADKDVQETVAYCIEGVAKAQYPNGAWPQGYERFPDPPGFPVKRASYPESWSREWPGSGQYWQRYTLNDNVHATLVETLLEVVRIYEAPRAGEDRAGLARICREAVKKAGEFILLAQMPEPQPGWAQQYDFEMHPAWARKFEPPAVTAGETQGILRTLLLLYNETGEARYLEPIPRALAYLRRSRLSDGRLARFYELLSNKPLYFTRDYRLTHDDSDVPTHYGFKISDNTASIQREYERLKKSGPSRKPDEKPRLSDELRAQVKRIVAAQDAQGRWIEEGSLRHHPGAPGGNIVRSVTFIRNVQTLARYLGAIGVTALREAPREAPAARP